jgi:protein-S-isoprenylcysteine O-methyltransferase Ste14
MYYRLAKREESEMETKFAKEYREYQRRVPMFLPSLRARIVR